MITGQRVRVQVSAYILCCHILECSIKTALSVSSPSPHSMREGCIFSSQLGEGQLKWGVGHICNTPCQVCICPCEVFGDSRSINSLCDVSESHIIIIMQVLYSMADEYVPDYVDKKALAERQVHRSTVFTCANSLL